MITKKCNCDLCKRFNKNIHYGELELCDHKNKIILLNYADDVENGGEKDIEKELKIYLKNMVTEEEEEGSFVNICFLDAIYGIVGSISIIKYKDGLFWVSKLEKDKLFAKTLNEEKLIEIIEELHLCWSYGCEFSVEIIEEYTKIKLEEVKK